MSSGRNDRAIDRRIGIIAAAGLVAAFLLTLLVGTSVGANGSADLSVTKSDSPDPVPVGAAITYTIKVANAGPEDATNVVVTDDLPKGVRFVSADASQGSCAPSGKKSDQTVTCLLGTIAAPTGPSYSPTGASITIRVLAPKKAGTVTNTVSVAGDQQDPKAGDNTATAATRVIEPKAPKPVKPKAPTCRNRVATAVGTPGADVLKGTPRRDVILARGGDDRVLTFGGRDVVCAGRGDDVVKTGARSDSVFAGPGADRVLGRGGDDRLRGARGPDRLRGGRGSDLLAGGRGRDRCFGGPGADTLRSC